MTYFGNPNSANQRWSKWTFVVREAGRHVSRNAVEYNAAAWLAKGFGRAGRVRVKQTLRGWEIECLIEGPPAHDPAYLASVERAFRRFVEQGWGGLAVGSVRAALVAGSRQDGTPAAQLIELPYIVDRDLFRLKSG